MNKKYKNDLILIGAILLIALVGFLVLSLTAKSGNTVKVIVDGQVRQSLSLIQNTEIVISNEENQNILVIENGKAFIKSATCPDKICVSHRKISNAGETIICLPNKVVIEISYE